MNEVERRTRPFDVITLADACADLIVTGDVRPRFHQVEQFVDSFSVQPGGSGAIFASQMARLGASTAIVGWLGADLFGEYVRTELQKTGVDVTRVKRHPALHTCIGLALSEENDRAILTYAGTLDAPSANDLDPGLLSSCRHSHIAAFFLMRQLKPAWKPWLQLCRRSGVTTSLDTNWDPEESWGGVLELLPWIDVFLPNEAEALAISGKPDVHSAAHALAGNGCLVVVKRGEKGALAMLGDDCWEFRADQSPIRPQRVIDTTGAGDNFDAGFLRAWLRGDSIDECLLLGHRCAVASLAFAGGFAGQICELDTQPMRTESRIEE